MFNFTYCQREGLKRVTAAFKIINEMKSGTCEKCVELLVISLTLQRNGWFPFLTSEWSNTISKCGMLLLYYRVLIFSQFYIWDGFLLIWNPTFCFFFLIKKDIKVSITQHTDTDVEWSPSEEQILWRWFEGTHSQSSNSDWMIQAVSVAMVFRSINNTLEN